MRTSPGVSWPQSTCKDPKRITTQMPTALIISTVRAAAASVRAVWMLSSRVCALSVSKRSSSYRSRPKACTRATAVSASVICDAILPSFFRCLLAEALTVRYR